MVQQNQGDMTVHMERVEGTRASAKAEQIFVSAFTSVAEEAGPRPPRGHEVVGENCFFSVVSPPRAFEKSCPDSDVRLLTLLQRKTLSN